MGGFSSNYEGGYLTFNGVPKWIDKNRSTTKALKKYQIKKASRYQYLTVLLTPIEDLSPTQREIRENLCRECEEDILLQLKHNPNNNQDPKTIDIYLNQHFLGSIQKAFPSDQIDNTTIVNAFCFTKEKLKTIEALWDGMHFYLRDTNHTVQA